MSSTYFTDGETYIKAHWANEINNLNYKLLNNPKTIKDIREAISAVSNRGGSLSGKYQLRGSLEINDKSITDHTETTDKLKNEIKTLNEKIDFLSSVIEEFSPIIENKVKKGLKSIKKETT